MPRKLLLGFLVIAALLLATAMIAGCGALPPQSLLALPPNKGQLALPALLAPLVLPALLAPKVLQAPLQSLWSLPNLSPV